MVKLANNRAKEFVEASGKKVRKLEDSIKVAHCSSPLDGKSNERHNFRLTIVVSPKRRVIWKGSDAPKGCE